MSTRIHNSMFDCPNCNQRHTQETMFGRWIRNNKDLDSRNAGLCVVDQDYYAHKYKTEFGREFQLLMKIEIKTMGSKLTDAQKDTIMAINQVMRNRKQTPTKLLRFQAGDVTTRKIYSYVKHKKVYLRVYGYHLLTFSRLGPQDSDWIKWDITEISEETLTKILLFELDPDTLKPMDLRNHHRPHNRARQMVIPFKRKEGS